MKFGKPIAVLIAVILLSVTFGTLPSMVGSVQGEESDGGLEFSYSSGDSLEFQSVEPGQTSVETSNTLIITNTHDERTYLDITLTFYDIVGVEDNIVLSDNVEADCYQDATLVGTFSGVGNDVSLSNVTLSPGSSVHVVPRIVEVGQVREGNYTSTFSMQAYYDTGSMLAPAYSTDVFSTNVGQMSITIYGVGSFQLLYNDGGNIWDYGNQQAGAYLATTGNRLGVRNNGNLDISELLFKFNNLTGLTNASQNISTEGITLTQVLGNPLGGFNQGGTPEEDEFIDIAYSPNGSCIAILWENGNISRYDFGTGEYTRNWLSVPYPDVILEMKWVADNELLLNYYNTTAPNVALVMWHIDTDTGSAYSVDTDNSDGVDRIYSYGYLGASNTLWAQVDDASSNRDYMHLFHLGSGNTTTFLIPENGDTYNIGTREVGFFGDGPNWYALCHNASSGEKEIHYGNLSSPTGHVAMPLRDYPTAFQGELSTVVNGTDFYVVLEVQGMSYYTILNASTTNFSDLQTYISNIKSKAILETHQFVSNHESWLAILTSDTESSLTTYSKKVVNLTSGAVTSHSLGERYNGVFDIVEWGEYAENILFTTEYQNIYATPPNSSAVTTLVSSQEMVDVAFDPSERQFAYLTDSIHNTYRYDMLSGEIKEIYSDYNADLSLTNNDLTFSLDGSASGILESGSGASNRVINFPGATIDETNEFLVASGGNVAIRFTPDGSIGYYIEGNGLGNPYSIYAYDTTTSSILAGYPITAGAVGTNLAKVDAPTGFDIIERTSGNDLGVVIGGDVADQSQAIDYIDLTTGEVLDNEGFGTGSAVTYSHDIAVRRMQSAPSTYTTYFLRDTCNPTGTLYLQAINLDVSTGLMSSPTTIHSVGLNQRPTGARLSVNRYVGGMCYYDVDSSMGHLIAFGTGGYAPGPNTVMFDSTSTYARVNDVEIQSVTNRIVATGEDGLVWEAWDLGSGSWVDDIRSILPTNNKFAIGKKYVDGGLNDQDGTVNGEIYIIYPGWSGSGTSLPDAELNGYISSGATRWFKATLQRLPYDLDLQVFRGNYSVDAYVPSSSEWLGEQNSTKQLTIGRRSLVSHLFYTDGSAPLNFPRSLPDAVNVFSTDAFIIDNSDSTVPITSISGHLFDLFTNDPGAGVNDIIFLGNNADIYWYDEWDYSIDAPGASPIAISSLGVTNQFLQPFNGLSGAPSPIPAGESVYGRVVINDIAYNHIDLVGPYAYFGEFTITTVSNPASWPTVYHGTVGTDLAVSADTSYKVGEPNSTVEFPYSIYNNAGETLNVSNEVWFSSPWFSGIALDNASFSNVSHGETVYATLSVPIPSDTPGGQYVFTIRASSPDNVSVETLMAFTVYVQYENHFRGYLGQVGNATSISYQYLDNTEDMRFLGQTFPLNSSNDIALINIHNQPIQRVVFEFGNLTNGTDVLEHEMSARSFDGNHYVGDGNTVELYTGEPLIGVGKIYVVTGIIDDIMSSINGSRIYRNNFTITVTDLSANEYVLSPAEYTYQWKEVIYPVADAGMNLTVSLGEEFLLDGSGSNDSDGSIVEYAWDVDNDLVYEKLGMRVNHSFDTVGEHLIYLRVRDDDALADVDVVAVTVVENETPPVITLEPSVIELTAVPDETFDFTVSLAVENAPCSVYIQPLVESDLHGIQYTVTVFDSGGETVTTVENATIARELLFSTSTEGEYSVVVATTVPVEGEYTGLWNFTAESGNETDYALLSVDIDASVSSPINWWVIAILTIVIVIVAYSLYHKREKGRWPWQPKASHMHGPRIVPNRPPVGPRNPPGGGM